MLNDSGKSLVKTEETPPMEIEQENLNQNTFPAF